LESIQNSSIFQPAEIAPLETEIAPQGAISPTLKTTLYYKQCISALDHRLCREAYNCNLAFFRKPKDC